MSRIKIAFSKAHKMNGVLFKKGERAQVRIEKGNELISKGVAKEYKGDWPPKGKTKINLKDLKGDGKDNG